MNIQDLKKRLQAKERELVADISRIETEARGSRAVEVGDPADIAVSSESKEELFQETTSEWKVLLQVRDALKRMDEGTYGRCVDCGREIEPQRLNAIPWTPYCLEDQQRHDKEEMGDGAGGATL